MRRAFLSFILLSLFIFILASQALASGFSSTYIRLNNQKANAVLSGTACAKPSSSGAGVESSITITFPSDFTISSNPSNWTTNVANLSSGETNWPSIGANATSVSGNSVTFSSGDLTSGSNLYCFNFSSSASQTGSAGSDKTGTIYTQNGSSVTIDSSTYSLAVISNDQINITATIDPYTTDLPISIASLTPGTNFPQDSTIQYQVTYGLNTIQAFPVTIQASWSQGTIQGSPSPSVDILNYVVASATNAYGGTVPVIDTINRTITWTINSIPGGTTNQTVNFSLKTNSSYTGTHLVSFDISARAQSGATTTPDQTITQNYLYNASLVPTPTSEPTSGPTPTSGPSTSAGGTPTPTPTSIAPEAFAFKDLTIRSISQSSALIHTETTNNAIFTIYYSNNLKNFDKSIKTVSYSNTSDFTLDNLTPDTNYYFKIVAKNEQGASITSDIFTFNTAKISKAPSVSVNTLIVTSNKNILFNPTIPGSSGNVNYIVIPKSTVFEIQFSLEKYALVKGIQAFIRNKNVLGFSTINEALAYSNFVNITETSPGVFTGKLQTQPDKGIYELYLKIEDFNGNVVEQKIAEIVITDKFAVLDKNGSPVENARILLSLLNPKTRIYEVISPEVLQIENPSYSNPDGTADIVLPIGKYKAVISNIGYDDKTVEFEIGPYASNYPKVVLERQPFNIINYVKYQLNTFFDAVSSSQRFIRAYSTSYRFFDFITTATLLMFVFIALLSFSVKTHIPILSIPYFFIFKIRVMLAKDKKNTLFGTLIEKDSDKPVSKADIYIIDSAKNKILFHLKTNKLGEFYIGKINVDEFKINVVKKGYLQNNFSQIYLKDIKNLPIKLTVEKDNDEKLNMIGLMATYLEDFFGLSVEYLLIFALFFEVYFVFTFGLLKILPYISITIFNIFALILFIYKPRNVEN